MCVVAARRERRLGPQLPVGREPEQQHEAPGEHGVDASDRPVHAWASRRARSEMASSRASATQFATSGRAAVGHERQRDARQRGGAHDAADDQEGLQPERDREAGGQQLREPVTGEAGGLEPALDDEQVDEQQRRDAGEAGLVGDRRVDEVRLDRRHDRLPAVREQVAAAEPGPEGPAVGDRVERLHALIAGAVDVLPGVEPDVDAVGDVAARSGTRRRPRRRTARDRRRRR